MNETRTTRQPEAQAPAEEWNDSLLGDYLWSNTNFAEAVPDVMTPATWSLIRVLHVHTSTAVLPSGAIVTGNIGGRPYLNLSVTLAVLRATGMRPDAIIRRVEEVFGRFPRDLQFTVPSLFTVGEVLRTVPANVRLEIAFRRTIRRTPQFIAETPTRCRALRRTITGSADGADLADLWERELKPALYEAFTILRGAMKWVDGPAARLRHELVALVGPADASALLSDVSTGAESLASLGPVLGIDRVARGELTREEYLELYGHRGPHEWELSRPDPAEEPAWLERRLDEQTRSPADVPALLARQRAQFRAARERLADAHPRRVAAIERRIAAFSASARQREAVRSETTRVARLVRAYALRAGELTGLEENIFFLSLREMADCLAGRLAPAGTIPARRVAYQRYSALPPYPGIINGRFDPVAWAADPRRRVDLYDAAAPGPLAHVGGDSADTLTGFPGAPGLVVGIVRRLDKMEEGAQLQAGEILVTVTTNVGWTPLFPRAAAIVTDIGAPLSHAAIVARELGVPAVVGCGDATARLRSGDRVRVDGGQGVVQILERA